MATTVPEPDVSATIVPGCNILNQFAIGNYTGPIPCETNSLAPCQVAKVVIKPVKLAHTVLADVWNAFLFESNRSV